MNLSKYQRDGSSRKLAKVIDVVVIVGAARTPLAEFQGELSSLTTPELGAVAIEGAIKRAGVELALVDSVMMGCILSAGLGQAPARQAALKAGFGYDVHCATLNKMCGSGLQALMLANDVIQANTSQAMVVGGMESMSNAPYLLPAMRKGARIGHQGAQDHLYTDGLEDVYHQRLMGVYAEATAEKYRFSRDQQDHFALESLKRARLATEQGFFDNEIEPITIEYKDTATKISTDEHPRRVSSKKIATLKPAFIAGGTVTAANSSALADGAAALLITSAAFAKKHKLTPLAKIVAHASHSQAPEWFTTAPIAVIQKLLDKTGWKKDEVDLFEINEAFAAVAMAAMQDLKLSHDRLNVYGGACALGHPIGTSGARIVVTLLSALKQRQLKRGIAAICIGGGEAVAVAVERL